ncbi:Na+/H+ antiporter subunit A [Salisediminibacterium halotolerans]|uniref:Multicomponent Na+:H+ antiporter subunit A n=1 Tax=Salisediminibacterium halotolerans TaxID=517425 RepID=A0A1H9S3W7_9BACI|nr:Na+/H+ antiporter subunit A [Salisediminibacterium haloalkalitolerans]SER79654.1 multicomponent Na+:H+ antiporter subunit A [Salisediminibacterium haloalkalitolerans]
MSTLHIIPLAPFLFAFLIPLFYKKFRHIHTGWFVLPLPLIIFIYLLQFLPLGGTAFQPVEVTVAWVASLGIDFTVYLDGLSLLFALLISGIGTLVVLYSIYYIANKRDEPLNNFYVYLLMFMGAMLGVVLSDNLIVLYVFWELTSLSSALLIGYWYHKERSRYGAQKSMLITVTGGFAMLAGFTLLYLMTGTFSVQEIIAMSDQIAASPYFVPAMILVLAGAFTKSAQFPFHIWLPDAMEAPTPVSAYLHSATMVKAGIYLVARLTPLFGGQAEWFWIVTGFGLLTLLWGSVSAVRQKDLKGILAFSTVSQLGLIMSLLGMGSAAFHYDVIDGESLYTVAILAAVFHLFNHATFKGSLFMVVGIIDHETGTRDIRKLGGLMAIMPVTFTISLIGVASMAGLPPFNGFLSKEIFFEGALNITTLDMFNVETLGFLIPVVAWIASVFTFVYSMMMFFQTFTGKHKPEELPKHAHEAPVGMLISPAVLGLMVIVFGLFPNMLAYTVIEPAMQSILPGLLGEGEQFYVNIYHWHGLNTELLMTMGVVLIGTALFLNFDKLQQTAFYLGERDPLNGAYDNGLTGLISGAQYVDGVQMTGKLRHYFTYMFVFLVAVLSYALIRTNAFAIDFANTAQISPYMFFIILALSLATIAVPFMTKRVPAIILVGIIGFLVALIFVVIRAPDLALTQLLVETVMVVLFLLVFYHLPELRKESFKPVFKWSNLLISLSVGAVVTITGLSAHAFSHGHDISPISDYFVENAYALAGGENIVNVILVDFRGLDTLLEVFVLGIVALGVVVLIKYKASGREEV